MLVGFYTDNELSQSVMGAFHSQGVEVDHIKNFGLHLGKPCIFYGILRGSGVAMRYCNYAGTPYAYVDNGYFDALYVDKSMLKPMGGKYRIVKGDMIEPYEGPHTATQVENPMNFMLLPPSPYTAFMYDTTPEEWGYEWAQKLHSLGHKSFTRKKDADNALEVDLACCDAVLAFNSIAVVKAIEYGKPVYTTHGIVRNEQLLLDGLAPHYKIADIKKFYEHKQFTLREIATGEANCHLKSILGSMSEKKRPMKFASTA